MVRNKSADEKRIILKKVGSYNISQGPLDLPLLVRIANKKLFFCAEMIL